MVTWHLASRGTVDVDYNSDIYGPRIASGPIQMVASCSACGGRTNKLVDVELVGGGTEVESHRCRTGTSTIGHGSGYRLGKSGPCLVSIDSVMR